MSISVRTYTRQVFFIGPNIQARTCGCEYKDGSTSTMNAATKAFEDDADDIHDEAWM